MSVVGLQSPEAPTLSLSPLDLTLEEDKSSLVVYPLIFPIRDFEFF